LSGLLNAGAGDGAAPESEIGMIDQELVSKALQEIGRLSDEGVLPIDNGNLKHLDQQDSLLQHLVYMKEQGLISANLITVGREAVKPYRVTNIRLTIAGLKSCRS
jgi:hypothetical protein